MKKSTRRRAKAFIWLVAGLCLAGIVGVVIARALPRPTETLLAPATEVAESWRLVPGTADTLELKPQLIHTLGIRTAKVQRAATHDQLNLSGSLMLDSDRLVPVHSRFSGEVVSIGTVNTGEGGTRTLRLGDHVTKGQLLAVIWSKDVGEKKSDLVNALSKFYMDDLLLKSLRKLHDGEVPMARVREAERARESDVIEVDRMERTLRSWRLTEQEIDVVRAEAQKIHSGDDKDNSVDKSWAEIEVRSPFEGIVLEKNIVPGSIVDTDLNLFQIGDLRVMVVLAQVYEEDLPTLDALPRDKRRWTIHLQSRTNSEGIPGTFELIGNIVDPKVHTAAVRGWLDNKEGRLRDGQFVTAVVDLPANEDEVVIPDTALIEDGPSASVFVATDESGRHVTRRNVALVSRGENVAFVRSEPTAHDAANGCQPLKPDEWVVASGSIELDGALDTALATASKPDGVPN